MFPGRVQVLSGLALLAVGAVNAAGLWSIAASRRAASEETGRLFRAQARAWARTFEGRLASTRADLAFLAGSSPVVRLFDGGELTAEASFRRQAAEAALLLFLRSHPEITRLAVRGGDGAPVVLAGRRGGVPILWVAAQPTGEEGPAFAPDRPRARAVLPLPSGAGTGPRGSIEAEVAAGLLLAPAEREEAVPGGDSARCGVRDGTGAVLAPQPRLGEGEKRVSAAVDMAVEGWGRPAPWHLECEATEAAAMTLLEPVAARYRTTLALNGGAMALVVLLGVLVVREVRQRERLEARGREEARVRDLERQLFHAERLTTVGRLAAGIAHEINNPLEGMANYLSLAREAVEKGDLDGARRRLDGVRQGLERAALVVRQVLAHADPARAPRGPVDLGAVLAETVEFVRSRPEFAGIQFECGVPGSAVVEGSRIMLGQLALNLIVNACEAQPGGGSVEVSVRCQGGRAVAEVADRGAGIPDEERARVFEPFYSTKNSTGLGLAVCHSIARQHGGDLEALPRPGGGSLFRLTLPALSAHASEVA